MIVVLAGMAVAGPLLQADKEKTPTNSSMPQELILVIDDGVSQQTTHEGKESFTTSQTKAIASIDDLKPGDRVGLLLTAGPRSLVWPPTTDISAARATLVATKVSDTPSNIAATIDIATNTTPLIGIISEFRRGSIADISSTSKSTNPQETTTQTPSQTRLLLTPPNQTDVNNTQIISFEPQAKSPLSIKGGVPFQIKLRREGGRLGSDKSQINIVSDDNNRLSISSTWKDGQTEAVVNGTITISNSQRSETALRANLFQTDAQPADNSRFAILSTRNTVRVGIVDRVSINTNNQSFESNTRGGAWVERALRPTDDVGIETEMIEPTALNTQRCRGLDCVIVLRPDAIDMAGWAVLSQAVKSGLVVIVVPPPQTTNSAWQDVFLRAFDLGWSISQKATKSDPPISIQKSTTPHQLLFQLSSELEELIQPISVSQWFDISVPVNRGEVILEMGNKIPFLTRGTSDGSRGSILFFSAPPELDWTNLPTKPLMVPLFQELVRQSVAQVERGRQMIVGCDRLPNIISGAIGLKLTLGREGVVADDERVISVDPNGTLSQPVSLPGVYSAIDRSGRTVGWVVANIDPTAASTQPTSPEEIMGVFKNSTIIQNNKDITNDIASTSSTTTQTNNTTQTTSIARAFQGRSFAVWFFSALLLLLLGETWLAKYSSVGATTPKTAREHQ